jgi:hypothetical protein
LHSLGADGQWLHGSVEEAAGKLGGVAFFNGVSYALKGSKVRVDEDEAIHVPAKILAFLVLAESSCMLYSRYRNLSCKLPGPEAFAGHNDLQKREPTNCNLLFIDRRTSVH